MKNIFVVLGMFLALAFAVPAHADTKVKIATVPETYTPQNFSRSERVRMSSYHFEVNQQTNRARLVVVYTYRDEISYAHGDDGGGPKNTEIELPGLTYDATNHAVVYDSGSKKTVCATVQEKGGPAGHHLNAKKHGRLYRNHCRHRPCLVMLRGTIVRTLPSTFIFNVQVEIAWTLSRAHRARLAQGRCPQTCREISNAQDLRSGYSAERF